MSSVCVIILGLVIGFGAACMMLLASLMSSQREIAKRIEMMREYIRKANSE